MESQPNQSPLIAIVGETASGKTQLAIELARHFNGEIIAADSRTLYKGMDIGTAKPSKTEQQLIRHHLLDISTPDKPVTAATYKSLAQAAIDDISSRGKVPFLVGGTGLYIDAVLFDFSFAGTADTQLRERLQRLTVEELQAEVSRRGLELPRNQKNPRHLIRWLETGGQTPSDRRLRPNTLVLGLSAEPSTLRDKISVRVDRMLHEGLAKEAKALVRKYGPEGLVKQTIGYQEFLPYLQNQASLQEVREAIIRNTIAYAKRQRTWFRRNEHVYPIYKKEDAVDLITTFLNKVPVA